jgi:hypothetical protein
MTDDEIKKVISEAVRESMKECSGPCPLANIPVNFNHWSQSIHTIGDGNFDKGVERIRENHQYMSRLRKLQTRIGGWALNVIVVSIVGGVIAAIYFGFYGP